MLVSIKINKCQYLKWVNTCWYGTDTDECPQFTVEQARGLKDLLRSHYIYHYEIVENGKVIESVGSSANIPASIPVAPEAPVKKSIFKLSKSK